MCNCIEVINENLKEADINTALDVPFTISLNDMSDNTPRLTVATVKRDSKNRKKAQKVFCTFCPFCGEKYAA